MYLLFIRGGTYGFGWGSNPQREAFEGVGPEIETFLGPEMGTSVAIAIWAQKSRFQGPILQTPREIFGDDKLFHTFVKLPLSALLVVDCLNW